MKRLWLWTPLIGFVLFFVITAVRLYQPGDRAVPSKLVGKPLPTFSLPAGVDGKPGLASSDLASGKPRLLNIFASWCVPCVAEAPILMALKRQGVEIDAIALRDRPEDLAAFLARNGDPYVRIGADTGSTVQVALGSSGVPETFVIDGRGIIRHQHIGDVRPENVPEILAALEKAR